MRYAKYNNASYDLIHAFLTQEVEFLQKVIYCGRHCAIHTFDGETADMWRPNHPAVAYEPRVPGGSSSKTSTATPEIVLTPSRSIQLPH